MAKAAAKTGRPALPDDERRDKRLHVLTTEGERKELDRAAKIAGLDTSSWLRALGLERARQTEAAIAGAVQKAKRLRG